ncbi:phasin family protein [Nitrospirillum sp. BR 11828]|uniref:phasin family protein n=1 Tax=Nitrospirillum sp. BR 11828 TaxID=3104325 RepID=UPI002ACA0E82|nr:phasin family protein [Nitrospirillum sp. BR 11828]MDZ5646249.1 phasin family protein [Nitrospirillum sp. BR 11828]
MATNPFLDFDLMKFFDPSKFAEFTKVDFSKTLADYKVPGIDVDAFVSAQRKNIEAVTAANQLAVEGIQAVLRRQAEILRQSLEETSSVVSDFLSTGTPEDKVAKQAELVKTAFEKALANVKELAELVAKSNSEAADVLSNRVRESIEEVKAAIAKAQTKH